MTNILEIPHPRARMNIKEVLPNIQRQASQRATPPEIISSRLGIQLTGMKLNGDILAIFGDELTKLEETARELGQRPHQFILSQLSA